MEKRFENAKYRNASKLNRIDIEQIRWLWINRHNFGRVTQRELAWYYGVTQQQISRIVKRRQWRDVRRMVSTDEPPEPETMPKPESWGVDVMEAIEAHRPQESYVAMTPEEIGEIPF